MFVHGRGSEELGHSSLIYTTPMMSRPLQLRKSIIARLVSVAVAVLLLLEALRWRLEVGWAVTELDFVDARPRISRRSRISRSNPRIHPRITCRFTSSKEIRICRPVIDDNLSWIS